MHSSWILVFLGSILPQNIAQVIFHSLLKRSPTSIRFFSKKCIKKEEEGKKVLFSFLLPLNTGKSESLVSLCLVLCMEVNSELTNQRSRIEAANSQPPSIAASTHIYNAPFPTLPQRSVKTESDIILIIILHVRLKISASFFLRLVCLLSSSLLSGFSFTSLFLDELFSAECMMRRGIYIDTHASRSIVKATCLSSTICNGINFVYSLQLPWCTFLYDKCIKVLYYIFIRHFDDISASKKVNKTWWTGWCGKYCAKRNGKKNV